MNQLIQTIDPSALRVGDVFQHAAKLVVVYKVLDAWASVQPLARRQREVVARDLENGNDVKRIKFSVPEKTFNVSTHSEVNLLARLGEEWKTKNLANEVPGFVGEPINTGTGKTNSMSKNKVSNPRGGLAAAALADKTTKPAKAAKAPKVPGTPGIRSGSLGLVCGFSATSVLRALGAAGVTAAQARSILASKEASAKELGLPITIANGTVSIQIGHGKSGNLVPAPLTAEQLKSLKALIVEEAVPAKAEKPAKKSKKAAKTEAAANETAAVPAAEEPKADATSGTE